jgi:Rod binding domain-containing protein
VSEFQIPNIQSLVGDTMAGAAASRRRPESAPRDAAAAEKAAKDFEAILLHRLMEEMRRTIPKSGLLDTAISRQIDGLFWFYLAQEVADNGGIGLCSDLARNMGPLGQATPEAGHVGTKP